MGRVVCSKARSVGDGDLHRPAKHRNRLSIPDPLPRGAALFPIASVVAAVFLALAPQVVRFAVAVHLIFVGLVGLIGIYHIVKQNRSRAQSHPPRGRARAEGEIAVTWWKPAATGEHLTLRRGL